MAQAKAGVSEKAPIKWRLPKTASLKLGDDQLGIDFTGVVDTLGILLQLECPVLSMGYSHLTICPPENWSRQKTADGRFVIFMKGTPLFYYYGDHPTTLFLVTDPFVADTLKRDLQQTAA